MVPSNRSFGARVRHRKNVVCLISPNGINPLYNREYGRSELRRGGRMNG